MRNEVNDLPHSWRLKTVREIAELVVDGDHNPPKRVASGTPHLTAKSIKHGVISFEGCSFVSAEGFEQTKERYEPLPGDVIITCVGTIGECAIVPPGLKFSADRNLAAVRLVEGGLDRRLLYHYLCEPSVQHHLRSVCGSTAQPHLYLKDIRNLPVPIPPIGEQVRIVAKLEELLSELDAGEAALRCAQRRLTRYRQALLATTFSDPTFTRVDFDEALAVVSNGGRKLPQKDYCQSGTLPVIDQGEEEVGGFTDQMTLCYEGPLPVILFGDHTRRFKFVDHRFVQGADGIKILHPIGDWEPRFLLFALRAAEFPDKGYSRHFQYLRKITLPMPERSEQRAILAELDRRLSALEVMEATIQASLRRAERLRQSILERAFRGELVTQDPNDEPAEALLARMRAATTDVPTPRRRGRPPKAVNPAPRDSASRRAPKESTPAPALRKRGRPRKVKA